jgi:hypothetical protein
MHFASPRRGALIAPSNKTLPVAGLGLGYSRDYAYALLLAVAFNGPSTHGNLSFDHCLVR